MHSYEIIAALRAAGAKTWDDVLQSLEDGAALASIGVGDADQVAVEDLYEVALDAIEADCTPVADIFPGSFGEACFNTNSITELRVALRTIPDPVDLETWGISAVEYYRQIAAALRAKEEE